MNRERVDVVEFRGWGGLLDHDGVDAYTRARALLEMPGHQLLD